MLGFLLTDGTLPQRIEKSRVYDELVCNIEYHGVIATLIMLLFCRSKGNFILGLTRSGRVLNGDVRSVSKYTPRFYWHSASRLGSLQPSHSIVGSSIFLLTLKSSSPVQDEDNWRNSNMPTFTGIDCSYSLPENVAMITLQVTCTSCTCVAVM